MTDQHGYVFPTFTGNGEDGLHLLVSRDGYEWSDVDGFKSVYLQTEGLMRDPSICIGGDGRYHMTHTTEWFDHRIAVTHSDNLTDWSPTEYLYVWGDYAGVGTEESDGSAWRGADLTTPTERNLLVKNCWSPTIFFDPRTREYIIFWSTSIDSPQVFPDSWNPEIWEEMNHRIYYIVTRDFVTYSPRRLFYAPRDHQVIDGFVAAPTPDSYVMGIKDESLQQLHVVKSLRKLNTWAELPEDFWEDIGETTPFAGRNVPGVMVNAEGNAIFKAGDDWLIYCDYWRTQGNGAFLTRDFESFTDVTDRISLPRWTRNGKILAVPRGLAEDLLQYRTEGSGPEVAPIPQPSWAQTKEKYSNPA